MAYKNICEHKNRKYSEFIFNYDDERLEFSISDDWKCMDCKYESKYSREIMQGVILKPHFVNWNGKGFLDKFYVE